MARPLKQFDWSKLDAILQYGASLSDCADIMGVSEDLTERRTKKEFNLGFADYRLKKMSRMRLGLSRKQLERLQQLENLGQLLHFYNKSYEQVEIKENSIIYCDILYENTGGYDKNKYFNRVQFFDWADNQKGPVFISEYNIEDKRFVAINHVEKRVLLKPVGGNLIKVEKLYVNKAGYKKMREN